MCIPPATAQDCPTPAGSFRPPFARERLRVPRAPPQDLPFPRVPLPLQIRLPFAASARVLDSKPAAARSPRHSIAPQLPEPPRQTTRPPQRIAAAYRDSDAPQSKSPESDSRQRQFPPAARRRLACSARAPRPPPRPRSKSSRSSLSSPMTETSCRGPAPRWIPSCPPQESWPALQQTPEPLAPPTRRQTVSAA